MRDGMDRLSSGFFHLVQSLTDSLSTEPRATVEGVCYTFYDRQLLSGPDDGLKEQFFESLEDSIAEADRAFANYVDEEEFRLEITALRLELFGLALTQRVGWRRDDFCRRELVATRRYLQERDELRIWTSMGVYNQAIADAELWLNPSRLMRGRRLGLRLGLTDAWQNQGVPDGCLLRYINRHRAGTAWRQGIAVTSLIKAFSERLEFRPNAQGQMRLYALLHVFYDEAAQRLKGLRLS